MKKNSFSNRNTKNVQAHNLIVGFQSLYLAHTFLCTIPATSLSYERTFSKIKLLKLNLGLLKTKYTENLLLILYEKNIKLNLEKIVDNKINV